MNQLLIDYLVQHYPTAKRQTLKRMVEAGRVTINNTPARKLKQPLAEGDKVRVLAHGAADEAKGPARPDSLLRIVFEDDELLVVNKPAGLLTSTVPRERRPTLIALVRAHLAKTNSRDRAGVVHRLDRDAAGLLVFSKNHAAYRELKRQFFEHSVERIYHAVVEGIPVPPEGKIQTSLVELPDGSVHSTRLSGKGQRALTAYQVLRSDGGRSLLRVTLFTGRKHQIRVHLSERGHPVVGDSVYGKGIAGERLRLMAVKLAFKHPHTGKMVAFELHTPPDFF